MFETISHFVLGVVAIAILHIALTYGMSDKTNDNPKIRFLKTVCFVGAFVGANIMIILLLGVHYDIDFAKVGTRMRMETFYKIILGIREFPGCADLLLTYDDQEILHQLYNQNHIGIHIIGRNYSCRR